MKINVFRNVYIQKDFLPLLVWLNWLECRPINGKVMGSVPCQGTCLGCRFGLPLGHVWEETCRSMFLYFYLPFSLSGIMETVYICVRRSSPDDEVERENELLVLYSVLSSSVPVDHASSNVVCLFCPVSYLSPGDTRSFQAMSGGRGQMHPVFSTSSGVETN